MKNGLHVAVHLFSNRSHVMSQCGKNKKVARDMQLSLFQLSVIKMEQNSKQRNSSRGVKKQCILQHCLLLWYVLLTECLEQARYSGVCH